MAEVFFGHLDKLPEMLRTCSFDILLIRPLSPLAQLITSDLALRRFARTFIAVLGLMFALRLSLTHYSARPLLLTCAAVFFGTVIFAAVWVMAAGMQFWLINGTELTNSFTYGSSYISSFPTNILAAPVRVFFTFVIPAAFIGYLPTMLILDLPAAPGLPTWLGWSTPLAAIGSALGAYGWWRAGMRHYSGSGG